VDQYSTILENSSNQTRKSMWLYGKPDPQSYPVNFWILRLGLNKDEHPFCCVGRRFDLHRLVDRSKVCGWVDTQNVRRSAQYVRNTIEEFINSQLKRAQAQRTASANMQSRVVHHAPISSAGWAMHAQSRPLAHPADAHAPVHAPNLIFKCPT